MSSSSGIHDTNTQMAPQGLSQPRTLYHVYDKLSQNWDPRAVEPEHRDVSIKEFGLMARQLPFEVKKGQEYITGEILDAHLTPTNNTIRTPFISLWDNWESACADAEHRVTNPLVKFPLRNKRRNRTCVRIAIISYPKLVELGVEPTVFNLEQFLQSHEYAAAMSAGFEQPYVSPFSAIREKHKIDPSEWLALHSIPGEAIIKTVGWRAPELKRKIGSGGEERAPQQKPLHQRLRGFRARNLDYEHHVRLPQDSWQLFQPVVTDDTLWSLVQWSHIADSFGPDFGRTDFASKSQEEQSILLQDAIDWINNRLSRAVKRRLSDLADSLYLWLQMALSMGDPTWGSVSRRKFARFERHILRFFRKVPYLDDLPTIDEPKTQSLLRQLLAAIFNQDIITFDEMRETGVDLELVGQSQWVIKDNKFQFVLREPAIEPAESRSMIKRFNDEMDI
ncbi:hypothetical protein QBC41DRAFT_335085 [Cercophora samala]|uniref:DUF7587 domain-containing protein n=1 Tax=Cercophora samala TaxID=330535 RepID=A0AA39ZIG4_9PEZI|nr:hypothetical protein QBC41DRAFT_335085 [Cercophora samala]